MRGKATALVGAQYGSEGKGAIAHHIANRYSIHVRTGGPNAGHTIIHEGRTWKMQAIPVGWTNPEAVLVIGAGAVVDVDILTREVRELVLAGYEDVPERLHVDYRASLISGAAREYEGGVLGVMHKEIGSTGEGVGLARMGRIARGCAPWGPLNDFQRMGDVFGSTIRGPGFAVVDTVELLNDALAVGAPVLLEGTQGSGLSLTHGEWPYVTSHDTNAAQLFADAGLSPRDCGHVILVARTFPIRVAGNSGPLKGETTWEDVGQEPEQTTVTKKTRRVGTWDPHLFRRSVRLNQPTEVALTFLDYVIPKDKGVTTMKALSRDGLDVVTKIEMQHPVYVRYIGTGPDTVIDRGEMVT